MKVIPIEKKMPHYIFTTDNGVHVVPHIVVERWATGSLAPNEDCLKVIIKEWIEFTKAYRH